MPAPGRLPGRLLRLAGKAGEREDAGTRGPGLAIRAVHGEVKARYGSPRIHAELAAGGMPCCVNTVARLMRESGIAARTRRKFRCTTAPNHGRPVAESLADREFEPEGPDRVRADDITYIPTREGWLYLAAVEDLYSRRVVGWPMGERIDSRLVVDAPEMAASRRLPGEGLVAHSDRGSQHASEHHRRVLATRGITGSMSRRANCWDNAPTEPFLASPKKEAVHGGGFATRREARAESFEHIEVFNNRVRRRSAPGYRSPIELRESRIGR